jgi:hypothetical protein
MSYVELLFEQVQQEKLSIVTALTEQVEGKYDVNALLQVVETKSKWKLQRLVESIREDLYENYQNDRCNVSPEDRVFHGFTQTELENLKHYYYENSLYFRLFDCFLTERFTTTAAICDECDVTRSQYYSAVAELEHRLNAYGIRIVNQKLIGNEIVIRFLASQMYAHYFEPDAIWFYGEYQYSDRHVVALYDGYLRSYGKLDQHWLACTYYVTKKRLENHHFVDCSVDNHLFYCPLMTDNSDYIKIFTGFTDRLKAAASNVNVVKFSDEVLTGEVLSIFHMIVLSGMSFNFDTSPLYRPEVLAKIEAAEAAYARVYGAFSKEVLSDEVRDQLAVNLRLYLAKVLMLSGVAAFKSRKAVDLKVFKTYPVGATVALQMCVEALNAVLGPDASHEQRQLWYLEIGEEFMDVVLGIIESRSFTPVIKVCLEFSHNFKGDLITRKLLRRVPELNFQFIEDSEEADVLFTDLARFREQSDDRLDFFYDKVPSRETWKGIEEQLIAFSAHKYDWHQAAEKLETD